MDTQDIEKIIKIFEKANITALDLEMDNIKIKLQKNAEPKVVETVSTPSVTEHKEENKGTLVTSPLVGTFYQGSAKDAAPFVEKGQFVKQGDKLCIIEAMKVMNEITAPCDGIIEQIYVENEKMVEYGQKLFLIGEQYD